MTSTSGIAGQTDEDRATPLKTNPEMGSLTTGTLNFVGRKPSVVYVNTGDRSVPREDDARSEHKAGTRGLRRRLRPAGEAVDRGGPREGTGPFPARHGGRRRCPGDPGES